MTDEQWLSEWAKISSLSMSSWVRCQKPSSTPPAHQLGERTAFADAIRRPEQRTKDAWTQDQWLMRDLIDLLPACTKDLPGTWRPTARLRSRG